MHIQLKKALDNHAVNPDADDQEEHHFVLTQGLGRLERERGFCSDLVRSPPVFEYNDELWDVDDSVPLDFLHGYIEVVCAVDEAGKTFLEVSENSCRELLPFSTIWEHDMHDASEDEKEGTEGKEVDAAHPKYEFAEFTCANPLEAPASLHGRPSKELRVVLGLSEARSACEADPRCEAIAIEITNGEAQRFHLLDSFNCMPVTQSFHSTFGKNERVKLRYLAHDEQGLDHEVSGKVLESWSLESGEADVMVDFQPGGTRWIFAEHLVEEMEYTASSWPVLRKIREMKMVCDDFTERSSCDIYSKAMAQKLHAGTPSSCHQACLLNADHLHTCCVFANDVCALTRGEWFHAKESDSREFDTERAGACYWEPCSLDPSCGFRKGLPEPDASGIDAETVFFDFAHPLTLPFSIYKAENIIYHFTSEDPHLEAARRDKKRLVRPVGRIPADQRKAKRKPFRKLPKGLSRSDKKAIANFQNELSKTCSEFGRSIGRRLVAPSLQDALASDCESHATGHSFESCLMKAGCHAQDKEDPDHADWRPFSLPYDLLAWQTPAAFCCSSVYTSDARQEHMVKKLMEAADVEGVDLSRVDDSSARNRLKASVKSGSSALKKMLLRHISDEGELQWLGQVLRLALAQFKQILTDLQETADTESSDDVEITDDATTVLQVSDEGDQVTPSGRPGFVVARWSPEQGAFLEVNGPGHIAPRGALRKAWKLIASVPGAVYQYGVRPLWNFVAKPLMKWGMSLMKWILEHPRAALFISKFALIIRDRLCEKASVHIYGDPEVSAVGAFAYAAKSGKELNQYLRSTFSPAVVLDGLKNIMNSAPLLNTIAETGKFSFSLLLSWAGFAAGGPVVALLSTMSSLLASAGLEAGRRAMELMIYQEIAKEIPSNLFDMLTKKCLYKRENRLEATWNETQAEIVTAGKDAIVKVTETVQSAGKTLSDQMSRWTSFFSSVQT
eukprot:Skav219492  [mRNA]  locus=scaffold937:41514:44916:- [translate_table: standard]